MLESIKLISFLKTTGGKGLHLVVPIARRYDWQEVKAFAKRAAERLAKEKPERYLIRMSKAERRGRILIDYLRNDPTSTAIAPYSTRSREGAPVATPLAWEELNEKLDPKAFNEKTVPGRLKILRDDPWKEMTTMKQPLPSKI
jgi:bifunctional non-homologous end joining protein LigD